MNMISFKHVSRSFDGGQHFAVDDVSFDVREGETLVLVGSSGCGKTTLLKLTNRLLEPTSGTIELDGEDIAGQDPISLRRRIGYVFQGIGLFPHMTVEENVAMVPRLLGWPADKRRERANELLRTVGLDSETYAGRFPEELSGGQQQRVGVGRALAADPAYLLMDEPFGALDALTRDTLQQELLALKQGLKKTIVFVTHDIFEALALGDRIAVLHGGRLEQIGTREEILQNPATDFVRELFAKAAQQLAAYGELL
jgi:osmoprotectant transport system ATP-binding protein